MTGAYFRESRTASGPFQYEDRRSRYGDPHV